MHESLLRMKLKARFVQVFGTWLVDDSCLLKSVQDGIARRQVFGIGVIERVCVASRV